MDMFIAFDRQKAIKEMTNKSMLQILLLASLAVPAVVAQGMMTEGGRK